MRKIFAIRCLVLLFILTGTLQLQGKLIVRENPQATIAEGLNRPEGVAFCPSGNCIAIANSEGNLIAFYSRKGEGDFNYETFPSQVLRGDDSLIFYPHDVAFSPCGNYLAVANRFNNTITIYKKGAEGFYDHLPFFVLKHERFDGVGAVTFSPIKGILTIASTHSSEIFFYKFKEGKPEVNPYFILNSPYLDFPDGLSFSPDEKVLAVTSHHNHLVVVFQIEENMEQKFSEKKPLCLIKGEQTQLKYPHSVCFHPTGKYLFVSSAGGRASINIYQKDPETDGYSLTPVQTLETYDRETISYQKINPMECGAKGIALSPDGKTLAVCNPNYGAPDKVFIFKLTDEE